MCGVIMSLSAARPSFLSSQYLPASISASLCLSLSITTAGMADRLRRILGLGKKKEGEVGSTASEEPVECVVVEKTGSLTDIKKTFLKKCQPGRKRSRSETCLQPRAPLCGGESNISLYSLHSRKLQHNTASSQSMLGIIFHFMGLKLVF